MWQKIWSWVVVGALVLFLLAGGIAFMTSSHPWIADAFFLSGSGLFVANFLTWEDAKTPDRLKRASIIQSTLILTILILFTAIGGNHYLNRPIPTAENGGLGNSSFTQAEIDWDAILKSPLPPQPPMLAFVKPRPILTPPALPLTKHIEHPTGFLQFDTPVVTTAYDIIGADKQFGINMRSRNNSPERVLRSFGHSHVYLETAEDQSDKVVLSKFSEEIKGFRTKYISGAINGPEVAAGAHGIWGTVLTHPLTEDEAQGIISKKLRLYYLSWLVWTDLQHRMDWSNDCRWLQVPDNSQESSAGLVWYFCQ
jgi:hypothetical protein